MKEPDVMLVIINHNCNENVKSLKEGFSPYEEVFAIDSGSEIEDHQKNYFDLMLPNVYYSGLINAAFDKFKDKPDDYVVYFVASDVIFPDFQKAIENLKIAFSNPKVGVYAPSANASSHKQMIGRRSNRLREVTFVEGFCFAVRLGLLRKMCPVDLTVNQIGWGLDVYLGYLAIKNKMKSVVDYGVEVYHPLPSGYDSKKAKIQRDNWFELLGKEAKKFRKAISFPFGNSKLGLSLIKKRYK